MKPVSATFTPRIQDLHACFKYFSMLWHWTFARSKYKQEQHLELHAPAQDRLQGIGPLLPVPCLLAEAARGAGKKAQAKEEDCEEVCCV